VTADQFAALARSLVGRQGPFRIRTPLGPRRETLAIEALVLVPGSVPRLEIAARVLGGALDGVPRFRPVDPVGRAAIGTDALMLRSPEPVLVQRGPESCPRCASALAPDAAFCGDCGAAARFAVGALSGGDGHAGAPTSVFCPACGAPSRRCRISPNGEE
jgi:hypothetical protein